MPKTKVCTTCKIEKPLLAFYKNKSCKDGYAHQCAECNKKAGKTSYKKAIKICKKCGVKYKRKGTSNICLKCFKAFQYCTICEQILPLDHFHTKNGKPYSRCKECHNTIQRKKHEKTCEKCGIVFNSNYSISLCLECRKEFGICSNCGMIKLLEEFNKLNNALFGHVYRCRECQNEYQREKEYDIKKRKYRKNNGLCVKCGKKPHTKNNTMCKLCSKLARKSQLKRIKILKSQGLCVKCGKKKFMENQHSVKYPVCEDCNQIRLLRSRETSSDVIRAIKIKLVNGYGGKCVYCGETHIEFLSLDHVNNDGAEERRKYTGHMWIRAINEGFPDKYQVLCMSCNFKKGKLNRKHGSSKKVTISYKKNIVCTKCGEIKNDFSKKNWNVCRECANKLTRERNARIRKEVYEHFGNKCSCCGEKDYEKLTIDHINNDGAEHRKTLTTTIYRWLINNNYPPGFRLLCMNCNHAYAKYGYCPHERR